MEHSRNIKDIARDFERLLLETGIKDEQIDYKVFVDPNQGSGFTYENSYTGDAMKKVDRQELIKIIDDLVKISKDVEYGQGFGLSRHQIFCE